MNQHVAGATHKQGNILYLVITPNHDNLIKSVTVCDSNISDHYSVECNMDLLVSQPKLPFCYETGIDVNVRRLCNWIFAQAKIAIVYSRFNKYRSSGTHCVVRLFKAKVISRVNVEYQFVRFQNTVCNFVERWNTYKVLGKVENDNIVFNL